MEIRVYVCRGGGSLRVSKLYLVDFSKPVWRSPRVLRVRPRRFRVRTVRRSPRVRSGGGRGFFELDLYGAAPESQPPSASGGGLGFDLYLYSAAPEWFGWWPRIFELDLYGAAPECVDRKSVV